MSDRTRNIQIAELHADLKRMCMYDQRELLDEIVKSFKQEIESVEHECTDVKEQLSSLEQEFDGELADRDDVLRDVKYWFEDVMFLNKPMRDPRVIYRKVEAVTR